MSLQTFLLGMTFGIFCIPFLLVGGVMCCLRVGQVMENRRRKKRDIEKQERSNSEVRVLWD